MNNNKERFNSILIDETIIAIFIIINIINLYADELEKEYLLTKNVNNLKNANKIVIFTLSITIIIYIYFVYLNYKEYQNHKTSIYETRLIGSILVVIGLFCLIYFRIKNPELDTLDIIEGL